MTVTMWLFHSARNVILCVKIVHNIWFAILYVIFECHLSAHFVYVWRSRHLLFNVMLFIVCVSDLLFTTGLRHGDVKESRK